MVSNVTLDKGDDPCIPAIYLGHGHGARKPTEHVRCESRNTPSPAT